MMHKDDDMTELAEKPAQPADYACCESGCSPCIWDTYYEALAAWKAQQASIKKESDSE